MKTRTQQAVEYYIKKQGNCAQAIAVTYADLVGLDTAMLQRVMFGFGHGMGSRLATCGAISGVILLAGETGSKQGWDQKTMYALSKQITEAFQQRHGTITCQELKDAHSPHFTSCLDCIKDAAQIAEDILFPGVFEKK